MRRNKRAKNLSTEKKNPYSNKGSESTSNTFFLFSLLSFPLFISLFSLTHEVVLIPFLEASFSRYKFKYMFLATENKEPKETEREKYERMREWRSEEGRRSNIYMHH